MKKKILITGGSGTVGKEVVKQFYEWRDLFEINVFDVETKRTKQFYKKYRQEINVFYGDLREKKDVAKVCSDLNAVIHLAAIIPPLADENPALAEAVNVGGTKNLIECIEEQSPKAKFVYSSSVSVYGDRIKNPWIKVGDPLTPSDRDEYALTKIKCEQMLQESRLDWTIYRLGAIMSTENNRPIPTMFHMPLNTKMEICSPEDTGRAFVKTLDLFDHVKGRVFNLGGGEKCRLEYIDFLRRSFNHFGLGKVNFNEYAFARKNFHCGFYADGDELNNILDFRRDTVDDYFEMLRKSVSPVQKFFTKLFRRVIKYFIQKMSEPLEAIRRNNQTDINHYF